MKNSFKPILLIITLLILILVITFPKILEEFMKVYCLPQNSIFNDTERGTFGDMYGVLNSFLSGLSIIGIVLTLYWDKKQEIDKEKKLILIRLVICILFVKKLMQCFKNINLHLIHSILN